MMGDTLVKIATAVIDARAQYNDSVIKYGPSHPETIWALSELNFNAQLATTAINE